MSSLGKLVATCVAAGVVAAGSMFPIAGAAGLASNKMADSLAGTSADLIKGDLPSISTVTDAAGTPIAWLYDQQRVPVASEDISQQMKLAIIAIEDRRFADHSGVDWRGTLRAALTNATSGEVEQGASTIDQQLVKNYQFLVSAENDAERRAAVETTPARKVKEIRMALTLDAELSKDAILSKYLNLVSFGNGTFGVQTAAQTYFGVDARDLTVPQAAMLAGMVQSTSRFNPYTNPEDTQQRRDTVIATMVETGAITPAEGEAYTAEPLGVLERPNPLPRGCITAGSSGFFCDYVLQYLQENGLTREMVEQGGYTIRTTLDETVQSNVQRAVNTYGNPTAQGVAEVMSVVRPGKDSHKVVAMASSRQYGLELGDSQTVQPQPFSLVGDGGGSVFKVFTVAAAMEKGMGTNTTLPVPSRVQISGFGAGGAAGCPAAQYCVENAGSYPSALSVTDALAQSPNTTFVNLIKDVGVTPTVDMAVRLGMRSFDRKGTAPGGDSISGFVKKSNLGSFTLGPTAVNALELSNVGATISSGGVWCPPSPIESITDRTGARVELNEPKCEQVVEEGLADTLAVAMSKDAVGAGTAAAAASGAGWSRPMSGKTGTSEANRSSAFLGFTNHYAAAVYAFNDGTTTTELCTSPLRQCSYGNLFGGREPAQTWFSAFSPIADVYGPVQLPEPDPAYQAGTSGAAMPDVEGMSQSAATSLLTNAGFIVNSQFVSGTGRPYGTVVGVDGGTGIPGSQVTLRVSDGSGGSGGGAAGTQDQGTSGPGAAIGDQPVVINVPGLAPITISPPR
ncbi:transglycosylase domain-containing protein [Dietzia sp. ANT_WB102]|uniref:transglycosylase domain-containing protein n=1 Tax=Dietzia sp. ANT_WB102 TaxID=2597345 RepID=UPI0011EE4CFB|nr:transglycosylase domain-containing protein [Dietzia sp. ANT_WB102]KAA0917985.1 PASTA domain-containing protein [Dietzia sp. ANT_WB102]